MEPQEAMSPTESPIDQSTTPTEPKMEEVKPKDSHMVTIVSMAIFVLLTLTAVAFLYYQNQQLKSMLASYNQTTPSEEPSSEPTIKLAPEGYLGYNPDGLKFSLDFPQECKDLKCTTKDFSLTINPSAGGEGSTSKPIISKVKLGNYEWERRLFEEFATYGLDYNNDYYLIQVNYDPYSEAAQKYFEEILSTFKFLDSTPSASPAVVY